MNSGLNPADPTLVAAFRSALLHQGAIALIAIVFLWLIWATARTWRVAPAAAAGQRRAQRRALRRKPGDGGCCASGSACCGSSTGSCRRSRRWPAAWPPRSSSRPRRRRLAWVQHLVNWGGTAWSYHPIQAGAASVWIQVGIGGWLIIASRGPWSRLAGMASVGWGLIVWIFGESFGGIFAPGLSWLTGAPGAVLLYVVAGTLIALPESAWRGPRPGRLLLAGLGLFFLGMALLQAWPGRGFWQGTVDGKPGTLAGMVQSMSGTTQPHVLSSLLSGFGTFADRHGFAVNLVVVIALAAIGRDLPDRATPAGQVRGRVRDRVLPGRLGPGAGPRLPGRPRNRPEQHDPDGPAVLGRLPGPGTRAARGHRGRRGHRGGGVGRERRGAWVEVAAASGAGSHAGDREGPVGRGGRGAGRDLDRGGADGRGGGEPDRGPDPGRGDRGQQRQPGRSGAPASRSPTRTGGRSRWRACAARSC